MNEQDRIALPIIVILVALIVAGIIAWQLLRILTRQLESSRKLHDLLAKQLEAGNLVMSYRYDPSGDTLKYTASIYMIVLILFMLTSCCVLPAISSLVTWFTGKTIVELIGKL